MRTLATRAGGGIRPHAPALLKALVGGVQSERSGVVRKGYAWAAAAVLRHAADKRVTKSVGEACEMYTGEGADKDSRYAGGLILRELQRAAPEVFAAHAAQALPIAFGAALDGESDVAGVWKEVWQEGCASEAGAVRLYAGEIVSGLLAGLSSPQWGRKAACAQAVVALTELGSGVLGPRAHEHVRALGAALLEEARGGRLWEGKVRAGPQVVWCSRFSAVLYCTIQSREQHAGPQPLRRCLPHRTGEGARCPGCTCQG